jgi:hypothetical protein
LLLLAPAAEDADKRSPARTSRKGPVEFLGADRMDRKGRVEATARPASPAHSIHFPAADADAERTHIRRCDAGFGY